MHKLCLNPLESHLSLKRGYWCSSKEGNRVHYDQGKEEYRFLHYINIHALEENMPADSPFLASNWAIMNSISRALRVPFAISLIKMFSFCYVALQWRWIFFTQTPTHKDRHTHRYQIPQMESYQVLLLETFCSFLLLPCFSVAII